MKTKIVNADEPHAIQHAVDVLRHGGLVAFPTDTVYGLATTLSEEEVVDRLYIVKGRNTTKAIAVLMADAATLEQVSLNPNEETKRLAAAFWPGPLTLIVPKHPDLPDIISPNPTVGVRIPDHPIALALLTQTGPLAVTSANISGGANTTTPEEVLAQLDGRIHLVLNGGRTPGSIPSTVVVCTTSKPAILREGPIKLADIQAIL